MNSVSAGVFVAYIAALTSLPARADDPSKLYLVGGHSDVRTDVIRTEMREAGLTWLESLSQIDLHVGVPGNSREFQAEGIERLRASSHIRYVEENFIVRAVEVASTPNDPLWPQQQGMARLGAASAWLRQTGSASVVVAISDSGIDVEHPDLRARIWTNPGEIPGNGVDDDGNSLIDDVHGWDWVADTGVITDPNRHGTHVGGIVGAEANNGEGISGVNWEVTLMPLRFLDASGSGTTLGGIKTILYAADHGARVINASWGGGGSSRALLDAIEYAYSRDSLVIAAAGNNGRSADVSPHYPSGYDSLGVLSVASSEADGRLSGFSNFGQLVVDLAAPGSAILSALPGGQWGRMSGTSMAAPMVSGVAALMLAERPSLSPLDLRNGLLNAVVSRPDYAGRISTGGDLRADLAVGQLHESALQIWPSRITLARGATYEFSAFGTDEAVTWTVTPSSVASIDSVTGRLTALELGDVTVTATSPSGASASSQSVKVAAPTPGSGGGGGGGCLGLQAGESLSVNEAAGSSFSFALPLLVGWAAARRRSR